MSLRGQSFDVNDESSVRYIGSRQQLLYGCICFVVMFFEVYDNFDAVGMKNVDWLMCSVLDWGCSDIDDIVRKRGSGKVPYWKVLEEVEKSQFVSVFSTW